VKLLLLPAVLAALLAAGGAYASATVAPGKLVVKPRQVAPGYLLIPFGGGQTLQRPTLDECNLRFPSEKLRTARDRVTFQRGQADPTIVNEVVTYKPGGAAEALRDARAARARCPKGPVTSGGASVATTISVLHLKGALLPGFVALEIHVTGKVNGKAASLDGTALYQARGNVLSGVYAYAGDSPAQRISIMLHTAEESARILRTRG
jgi:hypothetical protein